MSQYAQNKTINKISENFETNPEYENYVNLLREYFKIKNDEQKLQKVFVEILLQHKKLVQSGILVV